VSSTEARRLGWPDHGVCAEGKGEARGGCGEESEVEKWQGGYALKRRFGEPNIRMPCGFLLDGYRVEGYVHTHTS